jgi:superfamily II DNA or RNA helicase
MDFFENLYPHQKEVLEKTSKHSKGVVCLPTGTGKTFCEAVIALTHVKQSPGFSLIVVNAPRIILTYQLLREFYTCFTEQGVDARYGFLHSGGPGDEAELESIRMNANLEGSDISFAHIPSHVSPIDLADYITLCRNSNLPVIIFSTYHSAEKIELTRNRVGCEIDIMINDEAHYLVQEEFYRILGVIEARRTYFFTATMTYSKTVNGRGMNNDSVFGGVLYQMSPRKAIELGLMVRPRLHFINTVESYTYQDYQKSIAKIIFESFDHHKTVIKSVSPKLLVSVRGTQDIVNFKKSEFYTQLRENGVDVYAISSHSDIGNDINGRKLRRQEFLKELKLAGETPQKQILVLHYDILSEGIDVSGFTGILPLRIIGKSKFLQTYGRAARLHPEDRINIISGTITPECLDKMQKPFAYIIIPNIVHEDDEYKSNFTSLVMELREYASTPFEILLLTESARGIPEQVPLDNITDIEKKIPQLGKIITEIISEVESARVAAMNSLTYLFFSMDDE